MLSQVIRRKYPFCCHNSAHQLGRGDVKGGVIALHAFSGRAGSQDMEHILRVAFFDGHCVDGRVSSTRCPYNIKGYPAIVGGEGDLEGADLVDHMPVQGDHVRRAEEDIRDALRDQVARHVVGDHGDRDPHVEGDAGGQARPLQVGPGLRADQPDLAALLLADQQDEADQGFSEALGQDGGVFRQQDRRVFGHSPGPVVAFVDPIQHRQKGQISQQLVGKKSVPKMGFRAESGLQRISW